MIKGQVKQAILIFIVLSIITGIIYPLFITGIAQLFFRGQANGSLIYRNGTPVGSSLIGQAFNDPRYFWGRISATSSVPFNAASSSGSNLGPSNPALLEEVKARVKALKDSDPDNTGPIPVDLVTSSASGLDPHISLAAAYFQAPRIARLRGLSQGTVKILIVKHTSGRLFGLIGEPVVNVLELNLALDEYKK
ncbi:MAG: potassium-transporting ATPase subunit KdpC [Candidatus Omnitrophica bacterium]|nr:potassium-transporting ATPase subunit KdpC [Candidatus Omnitrophota bacterium]